MTSVFVTPKKAPVEQELGIINHQSLKIEIQT